MLESMVVALVHSREFRKGLGGVDKAAAGAAGVATVMAASAMLEPLTFAWTYLWEFKKRPGGVDKAAADAVAVIVMAASAMLEPTVFAWTYLREFRKRLGGVDKAEAEVVAVFAAGVVAGMAASMVLSSAMVLLRQFFLDGARWSLSSSRGTSSTRFERTRAAAGSTTRAAATMLGFISVRTMVD